MCIWKVEPADRHCKYCSYFGGCEERVTERERKFEIDKTNALNAMGEIIPDDLVHPCRRTNVVWARYMVEYYLHSLGYSLKKVARVFHRGSHASVVKSEREVSRMLEFPDYFEEESKMWARFQENLLKTK